MMITFAQAYSSLLLKVSPDTITNVSENYQDTDEMRCV